MLIRTPGHRPVYPDLADRLRRLSVQFHGAVHEDGRQRMRDVERLRATEAAGWTELRVVHTDLDLVDPPGPASEPRILTLVRDCRQRFDAGRSPRALQLPGRP
ncbi:hypothetical protein C884_00575 [Kocuria palustris PEL]|uniref:DUF559 domain-containing protein n=2 Tax=Kocuria palustris TaxID=71999 RepID=M2YCC5_9MICC|nr:hypothetical protein C884_00575 [Kocuria palustris PEL]